MYYLVEIATGDSKIAGRAVYEYETEKEATATFHSKIGTAMKSELYTTQMVVILTAEGKTLARNYYTAE